MKQAFCPVHKNTVTEKRFLGYWCKLCQKIVKPSWHSFNSLR